MTKRVCRTLLIPAVAMLLAPCAFGQASVSAQLRGLVKDPAGAAVPGATMTVTNEATNTSEKVQTDDFGRYIFNTLRPDSYNVRVEGAGFKTVVHPHVVLRVAQQLDLDFTLEVGSVTSTVEVVAIAPLLNSVSAALGQEVENRYFTE